MSTVNGTPCDFYPGDYQLPDDIHKSYIISAILNSFLAVTAAIGNTLILSVLWQNSSLHAPSKALLCSLAATDFLVGVFAQPLAVLYYIASVVGKRLFCRTVRAIWLVFSTLLSSVSLILMVFISVDRLLALKMSLRYRQVVTFRRAVIVLIFTWIVAGPILPLTGLLAGKTVYSYVAAVGITLCVITASLCFYLIYKKLRQQGIKVRASMKNNVEGAATVRQHQVETSFEDARYKRFIVTASFLYIAMLLCYIPYFSSVAIMAVSGWSTGVEAAMAFAETLVMFNSTLNSFLYLWRVKEIRNAVRTKLSKTFCRDSSLDSSLDSSSVA